MKKVCVIGSTGSVGQKALRIAKDLGYEIKAIVGNSNLEKLAQQNAQYNPEFVGVIDHSVHKKANEMFGKKLVCGFDALTFSCYFDDVDVVVVSVTGFNGIFPLIEGLKNGKRVALANKESVVAGGEYLTKMFGKLLADPYSNNAKIIPLDSEHSAVFQCLKAGEKGDVKKIILTASGGAFYDWDLPRLCQITPADIFHPNWKMGRKITIDSCTMMNKALEIVEASWLFDCKNIDYVVHKESVIHSMVQFNDGSMVGQLCTPDMLLPIQYALTYPHRVQSKLSDFDLTKPLSICPKNPLFYAPNIAFDVVKMGGLGGVVLNASNEGAVALFEAGKIGFLDIARIVSHCVYNVEFKGSATVLDDIVATHNEIIDRVKSDYLAMISK